MSIQGNDGGDLLSLNLLPADFVRNRIRRRNHQRLKRMVAVFLVIVCSCSWLRLDHARRFLGERDQVVESVGQLSQHLQSPQAARNELVQLETKAHLVTLLRVRSLPTQVFSMIHHSRPPELQLSLLKLIRVDSASSPAPLGNNPLPGTTPPPEQSKVQRDLEALRKRSREERRQIRIEGLAPDDRSVAGFLGKLRRHPLSEDVRLEYTDRVETGTEMPLRKFALVISLKSPFQLFQEIPVDSRKVAQPEGNEQHSLPGLGIAESNQRGDIR